MCHFLLYFAAQLTNSLWLQVRIEHPDWLTTASNRQFPFRIKCYLYFTHRPRERVRERLPFDYLFVFSWLSLSVSLFPPLRQSIIQLLQAGTVRCGSFWPRPDTWAASVTVFLLCFWGEWESKWESIVPGVLCEVWQRLMYSGSQLYAYTSIKHKAFPRHLWAAA